MYCAGSKWNNGFPSPKEIKKDALVLELSNSVRIEIEQLLKRGVIGDIKDNTMKGVDLARVHRVYHTSLNFLLKHFANTYLNTIKEFSKNTIYWLESSLLVAVFMKYIF